MLSDEDLQDRAKEFLASAISDKEADPPRRFACLMNAINAAELAGKSLLGQATGAYPREHRISGALAYHGLIPLDVDERAVSDLFERYFEPRYGTASIIDDEDLDRAITIASELVNAAYNYPMGEFHPRRTGI